jgi:hypothetical protein
MNGSYRPGGRALVAQRPENERQVLPQQLRLSTIEIPANVLARDAIRVGLVFPRAGLPCDIEPGEAEDQRASPSRPSQTG